MSAPHSDDRDSQRYTLTRAQAAARLGVSTSTVRRYEWEQLHPQADNRGVWRFDPAEVDAIKGLAPDRRAPTATDTDAVERRAVARKGRLAAQVFRLFARNLSLPQIVLMTRQPPEVVRALYHDWMTGLDEGEWARTGR